MKLKDFISDFFLTIISPYLLEIILFPIALLVLYAKNLLLLLLVLLLAVLLFLFKRHKNDKEPR
ncbi:hypothetical protein ACVRZC_00710 [Streptococcus hyointestinalis]|uniref:Uncharacterized protein n=1 Tax=Streptococcus hyointestinalis TaxID=1337 RepID=A0A380K3P9_9STRE|nr:hypothetical protein [Streptococcus hyointestinalis]SUN59572.1 Uncharacterised protein [Streptococcus hyointestinalis]